MNTTRKELNEVFAIFAKIKIKNKNKTTTPKHNFLSKLIVLFFKKSVASKLLQKTEAES